MLICPKCNATLPDGAAFCNNCGANLSAPFQPENEAAASETLAGNTIFEEAKKKNKNAWIGMIAVIAAAVVVIIILIIVIAGNASSGSYKTPIQQYARNMTKGVTDYEPYLDCFYPEFVVSTYADLHTLADKVIPDATNDYDTDMIRYFEDAYADCSDSYGKKFKVTYEIRDTEKISDHDLKDLEDVYEALYDSLNDAIDFSDDEFYDSFASEIEADYNVSVTDKDKRSMKKIMTGFMKELKDIHIQSGYDVEVKFTIEGPDGRNSEKMNIKVIKVDGRWIIDPSTSLMVSDFGLGGLSIDNLF